jgi:hypothetical protein
MPVLPVFWSFVKRETGNLAAKTLSNFLHYETGDVGHVFMV